MKEAPMEAADKYRVFFQNSADAILMIDEGVFVECNDATVRMLRASSKSEVLQTHPSVLSPEYQPDGQRSYEKANQMIALAYEKGNHRFEWMHKRLDGEVFPVEVLLTAVPKTGRQRTLHVVWRDITDRKRIEQETLRQAERLQKYNDAIMELVMDPQLVIPPVKHAMQRICVCASRTLEVERVGLWFLVNDDLELVCRDLYESTRDHHSEGAVLEASQYPRYFEAVESSKVVDADDAVNDPRTSEFAERYLGPLGITSMLDAAIRIRGEVVGVVCVEHVGPIRKWHSEDVAFVSRIADQVSNVMLAEERRQASQALLDSEQKLQQARKMEAIGQLAGGIAHDFNNMLSGIMGGAELIALRSQDNPKVSQYAGLVMDTAERARDLIDRLMDFSRKSEMSFVQIDLHELLETTVQLLERSIDRRIQIHQDFDATDIVVTGDRSQLQNAFLNLGINARDAMPDGGRLMLCTTNVSLTRQGASRLAEDLAAGDYIQIEVRDTGIGMSEDVAQRAFEPFYTTKEPGKGTGLGLAAVYGIFQSHRGTISLRSRVGAGTTFTALLPLSKKPPSVSPVEPEEVHNLAGSGRILVIDDEEIVRVTLLNMLRDLGYEVHVAEDGQAGIELFRSMRDQFDLVITDMIMPRLNGRDCFYQLRELDPKLKVILCSGYTRDTSVSRLMADGLAAFVRKPFQHKMLGATIKSVLSAPNPSSAY